MMFNAMQVCVWEVGANYGEIDCKINKQMRKERKKLIKSAKRKQDKR